MVKITDGFFYLLEVACRVSAKYIIDEYDISGFQSCH